MQRGALIANGRLKTLNKDGNIFRWQYNTVSGTDADTKAELKAAIANEGNIEVTADVTHAITVATLNIKAAASLNFTGAISTVATLNI